MLAGLKNELSNGSEGEKNVGKVREGGEDQKEERRSERGEKKE